MTKIRLFTISEFVRARKAMGFTQAQLGKRLSVTGNHIAKVEAGCVPLSLKLQVKMYTLTRKHGTIKPKKPLLIA